MTHTRDDEHERSDVTRGRAEERVAPVAPSSPSRLLDSSPDYWHGYWMGTVTFAIALGFVERCT